MSSLDLFNKIEDISDIQAVSSDTEDGESHYVEFKQVRLDLYVANKADVGDFKLDIAKEVSAFANTDSGVIILGYDGEAKKVINNTANLQDWVDKNLADMLEPRLSGVMTKTVGSKDKVVVMYSPKGRAIPYRVASVGSCSPKRRANLREYYQRIGTNSVPIPEPIVRTMYRSSDSALDIEIFPKIIEAKDHVHESEGGRGFLRLGLFVKPDSTRLIEKYYLSSEAHLLDRNFKKLNKEPIVINEGSLKDTVIPPANKLFRLSSLDIRSAIKSHAPSWTAIDVENMDYGGQDTETVSHDTFQNMYAVHIRTEYACDGMPTREDERIIVFGFKRDIDDDSWYEESYWIDERCMVIRYISFGPNDDSTPMYAMEAYIRKNINHEQ